MKLNKLIVIWDKTTSPSTARSRSPTPPTSASASRRRAGTPWRSTATTPKKSRPLLKAQKSDKPTLISARTVIGFGSPNKAGTNKVHGSPLGEEEIALARKELGWEHPAFVIPDEILGHWRAAGSRGAEARKAWETRLAASSDKAEFERRASGKLPEGFKPAMAGYKKKLAEEKPKLATRASSQNALEVLNGVVPETIGGSADLTGSNNTNTSQTLPFSADDYSGRYIHYGIREHGMASAMNGIALHGGLYPYGGTFMCFTDYCRPSIRLAALMASASVSS